MVASSLIAALIKKKSENANEVNRVCLYGRYFTLIKVIREFMHFSETVSLDNILCDAFLYQQLSEYNCWFFLQTKILI